jgi:hypothetical protein
MVQVCKQTLFYAYLLYFWQVVLKKMTIQEFSIRGDSSNLQEKFLVIIYALNHIYFYSTLNLSQMHTFTIFQFIQNEATRSQYNMVSIACEIMTLNPIYITLTVRLTIIFFFKWDQILTRHKNFVL